MIHSFSAFILKLIGWKVDGGFPSEEEVPKLIVVVGPHTSFMDFFIGVLVRAQQRRTVYYLGKKALFSHPFGFLLRWLGGYPVDRSGNKGLVDSIVDMFEKREKFAIAITPEGTRRKVKELRSGFYHLSRKGNIPVQITGMDYSTKTVYFKTPYFPGEDFNAEEEKIRAFWKKLKGFHPEKGFP